MYLSREQESSRFENRRRGFLDMAIERAAQSGLWRAARDKASRALTALVARPASLRLTLGEGRALSLSNVRGCRIDCLSGQALITAAGLYPDYELGRGGRLDLAVPGKVVAVAVGGDARLVLRWR